MGRSKAIGVLLVLSAIITLFAASYAYHYYNLYQKAVESASQLAVITDKVQAEIEPVGSKSPKYNKETLSPAATLNKYITALKSGDNKLLNSLLSNNYIEKRTAEGKGVPEFPPQKISDVLIMVNDYDTNNAKEANYILQFNIDEESEPIYYNSGEYYFFVKLVYEDNAWKIDARATSP